MDLLSPLLAAGATPEFLVEAVALFLAGAVIAYGCFRLGLVPIVGFLVAGVVIGPHALGLVDDRELVDACAEVGVILLLFTIGIEFSLEKLARIQRLIFVGGGLQVVLASVATAGILRLFGVGWGSGLFTGFLVALSSTAIVLKLLGDRAESNAPHGQVGLGLLIFQDLAIIVMVLLVPILGGTGSMRTSLVELATALAKAAVLIVLVILVARRLMPKILELVARTCSPEIFLLTLVAICFGTAYVTSLAGVSLSLGAFLAGLVVSESRFSEHALGEILPLQILFSATFFLSVGMLLDLGFLARNLPLVLVALAAVLVVKVLTTGVSVLALGYRLPTAAAAGLMLAQVGEFSFVLERAGREVGLFPAGMAEAGSQVFIAATVVLMVLTPPLTALGVRLDRRLTAAATARAPAEPELELGELPALRNHVIVSGYGLAARRLVGLLRGSKIPYFVLTLSPTGANELEAEGLPVLRGDSTRRRTLELAGIEHAKMLLIPDDDPATAERIAQSARLLNPTLRIVVRTRFVAEVEELTTAGADQVVAEELESVVQLFTAVLASYRIPAAEILADEEVIRSGGYAALRFAERFAKPVVECELDDDCLDTRFVTLRRGSRATDEPLGELGLEEYGLTLREARRGGKPIPELSPDLRLQPGDEVLLTGSVAAFAASAPLFRSRLAGDLEEPAPTPPRRVDTHSPVTLEPRPPGVACVHFDRVRTVLPSAPGCETCLREGRRWVHLRLCMTCGHVGCCDTSPGKHATQHFHEAGHPIIRSLEPGEDWAWCFLDERMV